MSRLRLPVLLSLLAGSIPLGLPLGASSATAMEADHYTNPLKPTISGDGIVESCADPSVMRGRGEERNRWFMYCTTDPLNDQETVGTGQIPFHQIPMLVSRDLVHWRYLRDALPSKPSWAGSTASLWAPDIVYSKAFARYYLSFTVTDTDDATSGEPGCTSDNAIGVATSKSPTGPWRISDTPLVAPRRGGDGCNFLWTFDPDVLGNSIGKHSVLYYGSYYGGVQAQRVTLTRTGMHTDGAVTAVTEGTNRKPAVDPVALRSGRAYAGSARAAAATQVAIPNRYEGSNVVKHGDYYYYFGSATNCCNGPLTGYSVFSGRSKSPLGPFVDREGNSLLAGRVGGTPVVSMNGNRWVGTGHNSVFRDRSGQWWTIYHAVNRFDPYFKSQPGFTKRPALLDPLTWRHGWPSVRAGKWASDRRMPAPAAQLGEKSLYRPAPVARQVRGRELSRYTDSFTGTTLDGRWSWARQPADASTYGVTNGKFRFDVQNKDLSNDTGGVDQPATASVLLEDAPKGDFVVQTKVDFNLPDDGQEYNFAQAGLVLYRNKDSFVKLVHVGIFETRQTEWAKEIPTAPGPDLSRYGNTVVGAPGDETRLRIVKQTRNGRATFTAYTSADGKRWVRGGTWVHKGLGGDDLKIGLVSMGAVDPVPFTAKFSYVRVWTLK